MTRALLPRSLAVCLFLSLAAVPALGAPAPSFEGRYAGVATGYIATDEESGSAAIVVVASQGQATIEILRADESSPTVFQTTYGVSGGRVTMQFTSGFATGKLLGQIVDRERQLVFHFIITGFAGDAVDVNGVLTRE